MNKFTHTGIALRTHYGKTSSVEVNLRETANFWVTDDGRKYRKRSGSKPGDTWARDYLQLESVKVKP